MTGTKAIHYEVVDVDLAYVLYSGNDEREAEATRQAIELLRHRAIVKEMKP